MGLFKKWFHFLKGKKKEEYREEEQEQQENQVLSRDSVNLRDQGQRMNYVRSCLEQIKDAQDEIGQLTKEYGMVTSYLTDAEEIEALPALEKQELNRIADKMVAYEK